MIPVRLPVAGLIAGVAAFALSACGSSEDPAQSPPPAGVPVFLGGPNLTPAPEVSTPLTARVDATTDLPTRLELTLDDGQESWTVIPSPDYLTSHSVAVLGVKPDRLYSVTVIARASTGVPSAPVALSLTTPVLPADFPPLQVMITDPAQMEPGVTLFNLSALGVGVANTRLIIVDDAGDVIWSHQAASNIGDARRISNGNIIYNAGNNLIREIDMLGVVQAEWFADNMTPGGGPVGSIAMPFDTFHHEVFEILPDVPGGDSTFLTLGTELRSFSNYPADEVDPSITDPSAEVVGDLIIEFARDGGVVRTFSLLDILDPYRMSYDTLSNFWNGTYGNDSRDWSHANALVHDPSDDGLVVSLRHQELVFEISRQTGELRWMLGDPARWNLPWANYLLEPQPAGLSVVGGVVDSTLPGGASPADAGAPADFEWNYHQHAPKLTADGGLLLFDNGNGRAVPPKAALPAPERYSRAVEYVIDERALTVRQRWAYGGAGEGWYSGALGDADELTATGNVLVTDGFRFGAVGQVWGRVFEVTRDNPGQIVFEIVARDDSPTNPVSWLAYRAERLPSIYP